jgi:anaerobic dimethyl sulfoxide reductase subunit C (anchor subunit)
MAIEWALVLFTAVSGTGAWLFVAAALGELAKKDEVIGKAEAIVAFVLLAVGGCLSVLHLRHPEHILEALNRPASGIFIEALLVGLTALVILIYLILVWRNATAGARKAVAVVGIITGIVFSFACGSSYMMSARPAWDSIFLPLAYLGTAAAAGTSLNLLIKIVRKGDAQSVRLASLLALGGGVAGAVLALAYCLAAGGVLLSGEGNTSIWLIALFLALVVAAIGSVFAGKQAEKGLGLAALAVVGGVVGAVSLRAVMWLAGAPVLDFFNSL